MNKNIYFIVLSFSLLSNIYGSPYKYKAAYCAMTRYDAAVEPYGSYGNPMGHAAGYFTGLQYDPVRHRVNVTNKESDFLGISVDGYLTKAPFILTNDKKLFWGSKKDLGSHGEFTLKEANTIVESEKTKNIFKNEKMRIQGETLKHTIVTTFGTDHHIKLGRGKTYCYEINVNEAILKKITDSLNNKLSKHSFHYHPLGNNCASVLSAVWGEVGLVKLRYQMKSLFDLPWSYSIPVNELSRVRDSFYFNFQDKSKEFTYRYEPSKELYNLVVKNRYLPWISQGKFKEHKMLASKGNNKVFRENMTLIKWKFFFPRFMWALLTYPLPDSWVNTKESKDIQRFLHYYKDDAINEKRDLAIKSFLDLRSRELLRNNKLSARSRMFWKAVQEILSE